MTSADGSGDAATVHRRVLVAIDDSREATRAFSYYVTHMHASHNDLVLVHCAEPPVPIVPNQPALHSLLVPGRVYQDMLEVENQRVRELEDRFSDMLRQAGLKGRVEVWYRGCAGEAIVAAAAKYDATLVVMGSRPWGHAGFAGSLGRVLLGSVSDYVLHHAHCPVLIYRQEGEDGGEEEEEDGV